MYGCKWTSTIGITHTAQHTHTHTRGHSSFPGSTRQPPSYRYTTQQGHHNSAGITSHIITITNVPHKYYIMCVHYHVCVISIEICYKFINTITECGKSKCRKRLKAHVTCTEDILTHAYTHTHTHTHTKGWERVFKLQCST